MPNPLVLRRMHVCSLQRMHVCSLRMHVLTAAMHVLTAAHACVLTAAHACVLTARPPPFPPYSHLQGTQRLPNPLVLRLSFGEGAQRLTKLVGVLEFSAPEERVLVPDWVLEALDSTPGSLLEVATADVPRATRISLRPVRREGLCRTSDGFDARVALERGLWGIYTCLSSGDVIRIQMGDDDETEVLVGELCGGLSELPLPTVCIVDVDELVCDVGESLENERERLEEEARQEEERQRQAAEEAARQQRAAAQAAAVEAARRAKEEEAAREARVREAAQAHAASEAARLQQLLAAEPPLGASATAVRVQLPGGRIQRRFEKSTPLAQVRLWVESNLSPEQHGARHGRFELVSHMPGTARFVAALANEQLTLEQAGLHPSVAFNFDSKAPVQEEEGAAAEGSSMSELDMAASTPLSLARTLSEQL